MVVYVSNLNRGPSGSNLLEYQQRVWTIITTTRKITIPLFTAIHIIPIQYKEYMLNPHSGSCIQKSIDHMNQADAKAHCLSKGEQLATFKTAESMQWLRDQHITRGGGTFSCCRTAKNYESFFFQMN